MGNLDIDKFIEENKTPRTILHEYHFQLINIIVKEMAKQGISKIELAKRIGVSKSLLNNIFEGYNMNLITLAKVDKALGLNIVFSKKEENNG